MPWLVLAVLLHLQGRLSPLRTAVLSGAAVVCMGGVNAVETAACLPLAMILVVWGVTRKLTSIRFAAGWFAAVGAGCLWWALPLLVLARYAPPFYEYVESAQDTTALVGWSEAARGDSSWIAYLVSGDQPWWPAAFHLATDPVLIAVAAVVAGDRPGRSDPPRQCDQAPADAGRRPRTRVPDDRARRSRRGAGGRRGARPARRRAPDLPQRAQDRPGGPAADRDRFRLCRRPWGAAARRARATAPYGGAPAPARTAAGGPGPRPALPARATPGRRAGTRSRRTGSRPSPTWPSTHPAASTAAGRWSSPVRGSPSTSGAGRSTSRCSILGDAPMVSRSQVPLIPGESIRYLSALDQLIATGRATEALAASWPAPGSPTWYSAATCCAA